MLHRQDKQETYLLLNDGNIFKLNFHIFCESQRATWAQNTTSVLSSRWCWWNFYLEVKNQNEEKGRILSEVSSCRRIVVNLTIKISKYWKTVKSTRCLGLRSSMISIRCILETSGKHFALLSARCQRRLQNRYVWERKKSSKKYNISK